MTKDKGSWKIKTNFLSCQPISEGRLRKRGMIQFIILFYKFLPKMAVHYFQTNLYITPRCRSVFHGFMLYLTKTMNWGHIHKKILYLSQKQCLVVDSIKIQNQRTRKDFTGISNPTLISCFNMPYCGNKFLAPRPIL